VQTSVNVAMATVVSPQFDMRLTLNLASTSSLLNPAISAILSEFDVPTGTKQKLGLDFVADDFACGCPVAVDALESRFGSVMTLTQISVNNFECVWLSLSNSVSFG
jgi:hypothetical protein